MRFNIYYLTSSGVRLSILDKPVGKVVDWVQAILLSGGEITGIINVEDD